MFADFYETDKNKLDQKYSQYSLSKCPHCGMVPVEENTKKFKCNNCNEFVFVKKINYKYYFLTESQSKEVGEMRKFDALKEKYFNTLVNNGYAQNQLDNDFDRNKITSIEQLKDFIWSSLNNIVSANANDLKVKSFLYFAMARFCAMERNGDKVYDLQKIAFDCQLMCDRELVKSDIIYDVKIYSYPTNPECYKDHNKTLPYEEMIKNPILPHLVKDSKMGCTCTYSVVARIDEDGLFVWKD